MENNFIKKMGKLLEPFALLLLIALFVIPAATVLNLEPITKVIKNGVSVLGVSSNNSVSVVLVEGSHNVFKDESLELLNDGSYTYSVNISDRVANLYSKPILEVTNNTEETKTLVFDATGNTDSSSNINLLVGDDSYRIQDISGNMYTQEISLAPGESSIIFLSVENIVNVQFSDVLSIFISEK